MLEGADISLNCRQCGKQFVFTRGEQEFYERKGLITPSRCQECRSAKQNQPQHAVCSQCGTELEKGASIYCTSCLASVQLEFELNAKQSEIAADKVRTELQDVEFQKAELAESLRQKDQLVAELKTKIDDLSQDLEKAHQFHASLGWPEQALNGIEEKLGALKNIEERLEALEQSQNKTNQRILQVVQRIHEMYENITLLEIIKRSLRGYQKQVPGSTEATFGKR